MLREGGGTHLRAEQDINRAFGRCTRLHDEIELVAVGVVHFRAVQTISSATGRFRSRRETELKLQQTPFVGDRKKF